MTRRALLLGALAAPALARAAETWPTRPVRLIVPFQAGGPVEIPARFIAEHLSPLLGQPVLVEPKPGAGGALGIGYVAQQADPHALLVTTSAVAILPALMRQPGFDPLVDLSPISMVLDAPMVLLARGDSRFGSLAQVLETARARPGAISYGSSGAGSTTHLAGALLGVKAGAEFLHIPYRGAAQAATALLAGDTDLMVTGAGEALPHVREGRMRALAVTGTERIPQLPAVPAVGELVPGYAMAIWYAMLGPRGMPAEAVQRIAAAIAPLRDGSPLAQRAAENAQTLLLDGPGPLAERLAREVPLWKAVARQAGIQAE